MRRLGGINLDDFDRAFDQFFDELLIERWRGGKAREEFERAEVLDHGDRYEVRVGVPGRDPRQIDVQVTGQRLTVRAPGEISGLTESSFSFSQEVDAEAVTAQWSNDMLTVSLPKRKARRIALKDS